MAMIIQGDVKKEERMDYYGPGGGISQGEVGCGGIWKKYEELGENQVFPD